MKLTLDGRSLSINKVYTAAMGSNNTIALAPSAKKAMQRSRSLVEEWLSNNEVIYGVTTGFGEFANVRIPFDKIELLQRNLIVSHAAGAGDPLPYEVVRAMMILRINALAKGFSGIRPETVEFIVKFFNAGLIPVVPSQGSVGSSGDLVQLAHLVLTMMGHGSIYDSNTGKINASGTLLKRYSMKPLRLTAKEGLALINGTQMMTAFASLIIHESLQLMKLADIACAMSVEALKGTDTAFDERIHKLRPYKGQLSSAANLRKLMKGSEIRESHRHDDDRVQDAYSLRCAPQVHGAS
ncbi:MAG: aromatic amino acid lyase, partial [Bacteroidetes bacterium]|nr:aromatic amino acid lyase [Bacteroidota bacterium]